MDTKDAIMIHCVSPVHPKQVSGSYKFMNNFVRSEIHENVPVNAKIELFISQH